MPKIRKEQIMTNREFYETVINANINDEITAYASAAIEKMDKANEKRRNTPTKSQKENEPIIAAITEILNDEVKTASDIAATLEISVQKASSLLTKLVKDGIATSEDIKVPKKGTVKGYKLAE